MADDNRRLALRLVDGLDLPDGLLRVYRPGEEVEDEDGRVRALPRFFYEVPSWEAALQTALAPHFMLYEFVSVDVREDAAARAWPRYVPCAAALLAAALETFRRAVGETVFIAANGGYRSPAHALDQRDGSAAASPHQWGTAVDVYRVGDRWLEDEATINRYRDVVRDVLPGAWVRPYGTGPGATDDHLHLDFGYTLAVPHAAPDAA